MSVRHSFLYSPWYQGKIEGSVTYTGFPSHMDVKLSFKDGSRYDMVCSLFDSKKLEGNVTNGPKFLDFACKGIFFDCRTFQPQTFQLQSQKELFNPLIFNHKPFNPRYFNHDIFRKNSKPRLWNSKLFNHEIFDQRVVIK